ncbi:MAG: serine/threonine protein kinase [Labilithrix sp.]|nr:serine/threonine protein kinase [Labilithrix sp.]MCW5832310.1 serine/threonine protein kinase [Labilithrix sp.]
MANPEDLGRYRLKRLLGRGALGEVWEASDREEQGAKVAVKIMHAADDELAFARMAFAREARLASLLRHPHVVAVHDAGEAAGTSFMVMDMVEGKSLRSSMRDPETTLAEKLRWLRQVGDGLAAMHRAGIVHRDLKPENVIVRPDRTACLVDLGIAKWVKVDRGGERDPTDTLEELDSPSARSDYAPPETIAEGLYDELGDQYAWGVLAYEVLTGAVPGESSPPLAARDDVPAAIAAAVDRARSSLRDERWDAMELLLDELVDHAASIAPPAPPGARAEKAARAASDPGARPPEGADEPADRGLGASKPRSPLRLVVAAGLLLLLAGLIVAALR